MEKRFNAYEDAFFNLNPEINDFKKKDKSSVVVHSKGINLHNQTISEKTTTPLYSRTIILQQLISNSQNESKNNKINTDNTFNITKKTDEYLFDAIMTMPPEQLTLLLYDGLLNFLNEVIIYINKRDIEKAHNASMRAQAIIIELISTLKYQYTLSSCLLSLYAYILDNIIYANYQKDSKLVQRMIILVHELRDTWFIAVKNARLEKNNATQS